MAAFLFAQLYFAVYPLFERVPPLLFWCIDLVLFAGALLGGLAILRILLRTKIRGAAIGWLIAAGIGELLCVWQFLALTFPWL